MNMARFAREFVAIAPYRAIPFSRTIRAMPHIQVVQAHTVLANPSNYPEIIVTSAQAIVQWSEGKRTSIQWLWSHRDLLRAWRRARVGKTGMEKSRRATQTVIASGAISRDDMNTFHKAQGYLRATFNQMAMPMGMFDAQLKVLACNDMETMHRYFACCNAHRHDSSLQSVGFLRWVSGCETNEILLWRMLRAASKH